MNSAQALLLRHTASALSRSGPNAALLVLTYHRVLAEPDPLLPDEPDAEAFASQLDLLTSIFRILPLAEARDRLGSGTLPSRSVCITFDDGYANNFDVALPLLLQKGVPATVFVATGFLDGGLMFNDTVIESVRRAGSELDLRAVGLDRYELTSLSARRLCIADILKRIKHRSPEDRRRLTGQIKAIAGGDLPRDLMMNVEQVRRLANQGIEVGAHTVSHPILTRIADDDARREMSDCKARLEQITGRPVRFFAYPNGRPVRDYDLRHVRLARAAGFELAVSTADGAVTRNSDVFQWPRLGLWGGSMLRAAIRIAAAFRTRQQESVVE